MVDAFLFILIMLLFVLLLMLMMLQAQQGAKADLSVGAASKPHQPLGSAALQFRTQVFNCFLLAGLAISLKILQMVNKFQLFSLESTAAAERLADYSRDSPLLGRCRSLSSSPCRHHQRLKHHHCYPKHHHHHQYIHLPNNIIMLLTIFIVTIECTTTPHIKIARNL